MEACPTPPRPSSPPVIHWLPVQCHYILVQEDLISSAKKHPASILCVPAPKEKRTCKGSSAPRPARLPSPSSLHFHLVPHEQFGGDGVGTFCIPEHGVRS